MATSQPVQVTAPLASTADAVEVVNNTPTATVKAKSAAVTITQPPLAVSNPGTIMEALIGAGVSYTAEIAAPNLSAVREAVLTATGTMETAWTSVALTNGTADLSVHLAHTGDHIEVVGTTAAGQVTVNSGTVTITEPPISLTAPGTLQGFTKGVSVSFEEEITAPSLGTVYEAVMTSAGSLETAWMAVKLTNGAATVATNMMFSGDYVEVVNNVANPTEIANSGTVTILPPPISLTSPGTIREAVVGGGVTFTEQITAPTLSTVYEAVITATGTIEAGWTAVTLNHGTASVSVHLAHTGDYVEVVNNPKTITAETKSSAVTITEPTLSVSSPGTIQEATVGAGVTYTATVMGVGVTNAWESVFTAGGVQETGWINVVFGASGTVMASAHLEHSGDYVEVENNAVGLIVKSSAVTITEPPTIKLIGTPGTLREATVGAGVSVSETIVATGLSTVYEAVRTSAGALETGWIAITLNNGTATVSAHLDHTGDYIDVVNSTTAATVEAKSPAVTLTEPPTITLIGTPGTIQEAAVGGGVTATEQIVATGLSTLYEAVRTSAGALETGWTAITLNNGTATVSAHLDHTGDYIDVVNNTTSATVEAKSSAVTITEPPTITIANAPGTMQEATVGAGVDYAVQVAATGLGTIYEAVRTASGDLETGWTAVAVDNGTASFSAHLEHSGDYVEVVSDPDTAAVEAVSGPVAITEPPTLALTSLPSLQEVTVGAGVTAEVQISSTGMANGTVYEAVFTADGAQETAWQSVTLNASGFATVSAHLGQSGDYVEAVDNTSAPSVEAKSGPVTITEPQPKDLVITDSFATTGAGTVLDAAGTTGTLDLQGLTLGETDVSMTGGAATIDGVATTINGTFTEIDDAGSTAALNATNIDNGTIVAGLGTVSVTTTGGSNTIDFTRTNSASSDTVVSGGSDDLVLGGAGTLTVTQTGGTVTVDAGSGSLAFQGGVGAAIVNGSAGMGPDIFNFGSGTATVTGGAGENTYVINVGTGSAATVDTVTNFNAAMDVIDLNGVSYADLLAAIASQSADGSSGTVVTFGDGTRLDLQGVARASANFFQTLDDTADAPTVFNNAAPALFASDPSATFIVPGGNGELALVGMTLGATDIALDGGQGTIDGATVDLFQGFTGLDLTEATGAVTVQASDLNAATILGGAGALTVDGGMAGLTVIAGTGAEHIIAGSGNLDFTGTASDAASVVEFDQGVGGTAVLRSLGQQDHVMLSGYSQDEVAQALLSQTSDGSGGTLLSLNDGTQIDFAGRTQVSASMLEQANGTAFSAPLVITDAYVAQVAANPSLATLSSAGTDGVLFLSGLTQGPSSVDLGSGAAEIDGVGGVTLGAGFSAVDATGSTASLSVTEVGNIGSPVTIVGGDGDTTVTTAAGVTNTIDLSNGGIPASAIETVTSSGQDTILGGSGTLSLTQSGLADAPASTMTFIGGTGQANVVTGSGTALLTGGDGNLVVQAGNGGNTTINAGAGSLDFTDAGSGGNTTIGFTLGNASQAVFENLTANDRIKLTGFAQGDLDTAITTQQSDGSSGTVLSFSDLTSMDFRGVSSMTENQFRLT